jgi:hypothetical protein
LVSPRPAALAGVPLAFAAGAIVARLLAQAPPQHLAADFKQPLIVVTAWGSRGIDFFVCIAAVVVLSTVALAFALGPRWNAGPSLAATLVLAAFALGAAFAWPVVFSSDVYAYAAYGDAVVHGHNPYHAVPHAQHGAFVDAARWQWGGVSFPASVYGPLFIAVAALATLAAGDRLPATLWMLRILAAAAFLASIVLFNDILAGRRHRRFAVAAYALNPIALWSIAEGHNDIFPLLALFGAFGLLRRGALRAAGLGRGLAPAFKLIALVPAIVAPLWIWGRRSPNAVRFGAATAIGLVLTAALALPLQLGTLVSITPHARYAPQFSFQSLVGLVPAAIVVVAATVTGVRALARGESGGALWVAIAVWLAIPNPYPWYALWIVPLAVALPPSRASLALYLATIFGVIRYLPDAFGNVPQLAGNILTIVQLAPLALAGFVEVNVSTPENSTNSR